MQWNRRLNLSVIKWPREEIKRIISVKIVICSYHYTIPTRDLSTHPIFPQSKKKGSLQIQALLPDRCVFKSWLYDLQAPWQGDAAWLPRLSHKGLCIAAFTFGALSRHVRVSALWGSPGHVGREGESALVAVLTWAIPVQPPEREVTASQILQTSPYPSWMPPRDITWCHKEQKNHLNSWPTESVSLIKWLLF